jgi:hypothetical protein
VNKITPINRRAVVVAPATPTADRYRSDLDNDYSIDDYCRLIPIEDLRTARQELTDALTPAPSSDVERCVAALIAAYPQRGPAVPDVYVAALAADLDGFPPDVIREACTEARRTIKFLPSCAEVYEIAQRLTNTRRRMIRRAEAMEREHERRQREAEETARRERERTERIETLEAKLRDILGDQAPEPGDYERADEVMRRNRSAFASARWRQWSKALEAGELGAARLCRRLAIAAQAKALASGSAMSPRLDCDQVFAVIGMAQTDEPAARKYLVDAEMERIPCGTHRTDAVMNWRHVNERIAAMVETWWAEVLHRNRGDFECAMAELRTRGAEQADVERFTLDLMNGTTGSAERQAELAAAYRARTEPGAQSNTAAPS